MAPGLIDTHAHLHYSGFETFPETKWEYAANLAYGVTTVYDPSAPSLDVFAQAELVEAGRMLGPRILSSGMVLYGGQQTSFYAEVDSLDDARRQVRRMKAYGARMIKVYQQPRRDQRLWFAQACREEGMLLTVEGAGELMTDVTTVVDGFTAFEHALPYELHDDVVQLLARAGTYYTPTLLVAYGGPHGRTGTSTRRPTRTRNQTLGRFVPHRMLDNFGRRTPWIAPDEYHFPAVARGAAAVQRAGGKVALGAHGQLQGLGVHWELWAHAGVGDTTGGVAMTPHQAWRAATQGRGRQAGLPAGPGNCRSREAGGPRRARRRSARRHPQQHDAALGDQEWRGVRGLDAEGAVACRKGVAEDVLGRKVTCRATITMARRREGTKVHDYHDNCGKPVRSGFRRARSDRGPARDAGSLCGIAGRVDARAIRAVGTRRESGRPARS